MEFDLRKFNKAEVLCVLYNAALPRGVGFVHYRPESMTVDEATELLAQQTNFDYLYGRVLKVNLTGDTFRDSSYDRDNGEGLASNLIILLDTFGFDRANEYAVTHHRRNLRVTVLEVEKSFDTPSTVEKVDGVTVFTLGMDEDLSAQVKFHLERAKENMA